MSNISLKAFRDQIDKEEKIKARNRKKIDKNNKKIALLIDNARDLEIDVIVDWLRQMKDWENDSLQSQSIKAYAQFNAGRVSGMQLAIDLLTTIQKKHLNK
tara:strand:+ start:161 stop:463 length:303 start_codon:yes stop_codon:yes gene_type:complete